MKTGRDAKAGMEMLMKAGGLERERVWTLPWKHYRGDQGGTREAGWRHARMPIWQMKD